MPWKPGFEGEAPTLGFVAIDWMTAMLAAPAKADYVPFTPYLEQEDFLLRFYELDPATGRFRYERGLLGRPRGWGKSPLLAAMACFEALGPCLFDGWDSDGQPVGKPWSEVRTPLVHIAAVSEDQTRNTWQPILEMLREGPAVDAHPGLEPMDTFVALPKGSIRQVTSSARSVKGAPSVFAVLDQTEEWVPSNNGPRLAQTIRTNCAKNGGRTVESPNAFIPGENSVAEMSAQTLALQAEGRTKVEAIYYDHREAPASTDLSERESLVAGLRHVYGDSSGHSEGCLLHEPPCAPGHVDIDTLVATIWDPATDVQVARSDFLNQITHSSDAWLSSPEWKACVDVEAVVTDRDVIALGFDGSRGRNRGTTDATALIGCRLSDRHVFEIGVWEQPPGWDPKLRGPWQVPSAEVDAQVRAAFAKYSVAAFYADPARWESYVAAWEADLGADLLKKASREHPIEWWMTGNRARSTVQALEAFERAVLDKELTHDGSSTLQKHVLNARRRTSRVGVQIAKEHPDSSNKIDAAVAAVIAYTAALDCIAAGVGKAPARRYAARRLY